MSWRLLGLVLCAVCVVIYRARPPGRARGCASIAVLALPFAVGVGAILGG